MKKKYYKPRRRQYGSLGFVYKIKSFPRRFARMRPAKKYSILGGIAAAVVIVLVALNINGYLGTPITALPASADASDNVDAQQVAADGETPAVTPAPTVTPTPLPTATPDPTLTEGMDSEEVRNLQQRLMDLGYLDLDETTTHYGPATQNAVSLFQRQMGIEQDGICGPKTLEQIYSDDAKHYLLVEGMEGDDIWSFQERLQELGYISKITGYYGTETIEALKQFQDRNGLSVDGKAGEETFNLIYSADAVPSASFVAEKQRQGNIDSFISVAESQLGKPYVWGASGPNSFDCSGLVTYCLRQAGSSTGRLNALGFSQNSNWEKITSMGNLQRGDLIFFKGNGRAVGHVGIVVSDGMMIDASSSNGKVVHRPYTSSWCTSSFVCGRRPW